MKFASFFKLLLPCFIALALSVPASAAITLYDKDETSFTTDGFFNTFYTRSNVDNGPTQSRVKMGFLPNYIGFNFKTKVDNLTLGGRSSFWVTINDSDTNPTDTAIDVRQFYATIDGDFGQVLIGKDFTLFNRSNIFLDEILTGFGKVGPGVDTDTVSFGNIGSGYTYPLPSAQITYRSPDLSGFKIAVGLIDPARNSAAADAEETVPRIEGEVTFNRKFGSVDVTAWTGFLTQTSESSTGDVDSEGFSYGARAKVAGFSLTASGFTGEGLGALGAVGGGANANVDSDGLLIQGSYTIDKIRLALSYGKTEVDNATQDEDETTIAALFYSVNSHLTLVAEYNVETVTSAGVDTDTDTIALGASVSF